MVRSPRRLDYYIPPTRTAHSQFFNRPTIYILCVTLLANAILVFCAFAMKNVWGGLLFAAITFPLNLMILVAATSLAPFVRRSGNTPVSLYVAVSILLPLSAILLDLLAMVGGGLLRGS